MSQNDVDIIERYTRQESRLPAALRRAIEDAWGGEPILLYALADLDAQMCLAQTWLALGPTQLAVATVHGDTLEGLRLIERSRITGVRVMPGLSCNVMTLLGSAGEPALGVLRYTFRQHRSLENIRFVLEEALDGRQVAAVDPDEEYVEALARPIRDAQALVAHNELAVIWRLLAYLRPYRRQVAVGMSAAALITVFSLVPPFLAGYLLDEVIAPVQAGATGVAQVASIAWIAVGAIGAVYLFRQLCAWLRLRLMSMLGERVARDLRDDLYEHLQTLSLSFYSRKKTGSLITRVSADTDRLWEFLALGVVDVSLSLVMLAGLGSVLIRLDWRLGLLMTLPVPLLCFAIFLHGQRLNRLFVRAWRKWSAMTDVLGDTIPGMRVVKAFNQEPREVRRFERRNHAVTDEFNRIHLQWTTFWPLLMLAIHGMTLGVWYFAVPRLLGLDGPALSQGTFVSFLLYTTMFVAPIEIIGQMARILNRATSSAHRVFEVLDSKPEVVDPKEPIRLEPVEGAIGFENVTFAYDGVRQILRGVSFAVEQGEMIGLVGPSGGGKTTITNLIARFYDATGGSVSIDGFDIRDLDSGHYRRQVGMVLQEPYLFHGSIADNIRYGNAEADLGDVVEAARAANAHDFVCSLEHGYDTVVGERGHTLSGGERQRISIARAILLDPRILILDEATSSVDTETERHIQEALERLTAGRTVIAIAHRLSTLRRADRIFVVEEGKVTEMGTHDELLANPASTYKRLYDMQLELAYAV